MSAFFTEYKPQILFTVFVLTSYFALRFFTHLIHKWLLKLEAKKFPEASTKKVDLVKKILNALWTVLAITALSFIFIDQSSNTQVLNNFKLILYLGILAVGTITIAGITDMWFKQSIKNKITNKEDSTSLRFLSYIAITGIYFVGVVFGLLAFPSMRNVAHAALGGAGVIALIAGAASQEALANVVGGIFIISFKPFKVGDTVKISETMVGTVTDITLRHTVLKNFENKMIVIPNSVINKERLINYNMGDLRNCKFVEMAISYDSDVALAKKIMQKECETHPLIIDARSRLDKKDGKPIVKTALTVINDSTMTIRAWAWSKSYGDSFVLQCDVNETIKARFDKVGIDLAYPTRTVILEKQSE